MDYSQLPKDIVTKIVKDHLRSYSQLVPFSGVCKSWRSAALQNYRLRLPGLLISRYSNRDSHEFKPFAEFAAFGFNPPPSTDPNRSTVRQRRVTIPLGFRDDIRFSDEYWRRRPRNNPCVASKDGWVLVIEPRPHVYYGSKRQPKPVRPYLLNPITGSSITLPTLRRPPSPTTTTTTKPRTITLGDVKKAIITSPPDDNDDCHVILVLGLNHELAWCKVGQMGQGGGQEGGQEGWRFYYRKIAWPDDATYFGGKLYLVRDNSVCVIDNLTHDHRGGPIAPRLIPFSSAMREYGSNYDDNSPIYTYTFSHLSHLGDDQLLVILRRCRDNMSDKFHDFKVYKLQLCDSAAAKAAESHSYDWEEVRSLDGHALFLGYSHESLCLPAASNGIREDRIYFAFSFDYGYYDLDYADDFGFCDWTRNDSGVFNISDQRMERFTRRGIGQHENYFWFLPVPWNISNKQMIVMAEAESRGPAKKKSKNKNDGPVVEAGWTLAKNKTQKNRYDQQHGINNDNTDNVTGCRHANKFQALLLADGEDEDENHENDDDDDDDIEDEGNDVEATS